MGFRNSLSGRSHVPSECVSSDCRALYHTLRRFEAAEEQNNNIIRDEIFDDNDNMI